MTYIILGLILAGTVLGITVFPDHLLDQVDQVSNIALHLMIFFVGISIGSSKTLLKDLKRLGFKVLILPLGTILGSLIGGLCVAVFFGLNVWNSLAISSGVGYYSLTGTLLSQLEGIEIGTIAFLSNILREAITFLFVPLLAKWHPATAISLGGATTMDMTLPLIRQYTNEKYAVVAFFHGAVLTIIVPILVNFFAAIS